MSEKSLIDAISHYQKDIDRCPGNKERMLRCIKRLYVMPIKVEHLQATGVGRSVNNLREMSGEVGDAATALVAKWKAMVAAEDLEEEEESSPVEEDEEEDRLVADKPDNRVSLEDDRSVKDKENIRLNYRIDKIKPDKVEQTDKLEKPSKNSEKHSKDNRSSRRSSKDQDSSLKKESSSKNHSSNSKEKSSEKHKESSRSEHNKSSSDKDKKHREEKDKHRSKDSSKHSSKDKDGSKDKDKNKHSSSSRKDKSVSKDKVSSSKDGDSSKKDRSKEVKEKTVKKEKRSRSREREKESRKCEKRKHHDKERQYDKHSKRIKKEKFSSEDEESDRESDIASERGSDSENDNDNLRSTESEGTEESGGESSGSDEASEPESYSKVKIKQEPLSDSGSERERDKKKRSRHDSQNKSSSSPEKSRRGDEMRPPSSSPNSQNLKALIKQNESKVKKEKNDRSSGDKNKKSKVKLEMNQDGSIDSGSGASFADALLGFDMAPSGSPKKKKKKEERTKDSSSRLSSASAASGSQASLSGRSRSPSQVSTASSYRSSSSPAKQDKKASHHDLSREVPEALLKNRVKLEPLSLDISSTLPEISTNYKPLPSVQSRHTPNQTFSEEQMFSIMTSKNQRTKVYSGYKYGQTLTVPSLYSLCIQVLYDNIDGLEYTGGVPFDILKPLLIKLNGEQLLNLEHYNPYLVEDTDDLWKFHCNKTFPKAHRDDMETWRETYLRSMDERELKLKRLTANITESMATKGPARQAKLAFVDSLAKPPRNVARKQAKYGTGSGSPTASTSGASISQIAAAQNQAKKKEIVSKAVVGGFTPLTPATEQVPGFNNPATAAKILKKKKAPLMAKALQLIKGNRFKR